MSLTELEMKELMEFVSQMMNQMLVTGQPVLKLLDPYGLVVSVAPNGDYFQTDIFDRLRCMIDDDHIELHDPPLFTGRRHLFEKDDFQDHLEKEALQQVEEKNLRAIFYIGALIRSMNIPSNIKTANETHYELPELSEQEETLIIDALRDCLECSMHTQDASYKIIEDLDLFLMTSYQLNQTTVVVHKLSDCFLTTEKEPSELPQNPIYIATLDPNNGFKGTANSDYKDTVFEKYYQFINVCLARSVKS
jgi:hypothetical protein